MITSFEDLCLYTYVIVDDIWQRIAPLFHRPGPAPACSDSELITIALISECRSWDSETELQDHWAWKISAGRGQPKVWNSSEPDVLHFHLDPFPGSDELMHWHLPYEFKQWRCNLWSILKRNFKR